MPDSCNECGEPLHVEDDVVVCPNGHRWELAGWAKVFSETGELEPLTGNRLPDEER